MNQLFLSQIKVAVICNSEEIIDKNSFDDFKEKVFDREYKINQAPNEIISSYFAEYELDESVINNFNNNLRLASKTALFFKETKDFLSKECPLNNYRTLEDKTLLWYCSLIVSKLNSKFDTTLYLNRIQEELNFFKVIVEEYFDDKKTCEKIECIFYYDLDSDYEYSGKNDSLLEKNVLNLICSLTYAYFYDDYSLLKNLLRIKEEIHSDSIFDKPYIFYMSESNKKIYISEVIRTIFETNNPLGQKELKVILSLLNYKNLFPIDYDENEFVLKISKRLFFSNPKKVKLMDFLFIGNQNQQDFLKKIQNQLEQLYIKEMLERIKNFSFVASSDSLHMLLQNLREKDFYHCKNAEGLTVLLKGLEDEIYNNNLFLPKLSGDISEEIWSKVHSIIDFMYSLTDKERLKKYLDAKISEAIESEEKERINVLFKKYFSL